MKWLCIMWKGMHKTELPPNSAGPLNSLKHVSVFQLLILIYSIIMQVLKNIFIVIFYYKEQFKQLGDWCCACCLVLLGLGYTSILFPRLPVPQTSFIKLMWKDIDNQVCRKKEKSVESVWNPWLKYSYIVIVLLIDAIIVKINYSPFYGNPLRPP